MFITLKKWEDRQRAATVQLRTLLRDLGRKQREMQRRAQRDLHAKFRVRHRRRLALQATLRKRIQQARGAAKACGLRIAVRYGFERT